MELGTKRLLEWKQTDKNSTFLKAVTRDSQGILGQIIGLAIWTHMKEVPPAEPAKVEEIEEIWPDQDDREFMARLWGDYIVPRTQAVESSGEKGVYGE
ncbi:hypothetical protein SLS62_001216 [Diatrype stigma]|uniref:Uncharacterized protein n=1 Tax=Diatrype stigma TaxID=117547 RepID=A0AAN9VAW7_9PEZI